jgi:long-chain acyl-CoA synthetase
MAEDEVRNASNNNADEVIRQCKQRLGLADPPETAPYQTIPGLLEFAASRYPDNPAFTCMDCTLSYAELDRLSSQFAAWLQNQQGLDHGDRIALQMPNLLQYPVAYFGVLRAGMVVVNVNPLYTERELEHQLNDSGAKMVIVYEGVAVNLEPVIADTGVETVVVTGIADLHSPVRRFLIDKVVRYVKKMIPGYRLPGSVLLRQVLAEGEKLPFAQHHSHAEGLAMLQYTGGTTGLAKGAMLSHANVLSGVSQGKQMLESSGISTGGEFMVLPLPLYHVYAFFVTMMMMAGGNRILLIPNPRDLKGFIRELGRHEYSIFVGLTTLFVGLCNTAAFGKLRFPALKLVLSGGMPLTRDAANRWEKITGVPIAEGYGLTETASATTCNPLQAIKLGTIGVPFSQTLVRVVDDQGCALPAGEPGELWIKGPQVMQGYWKKPDATDKVITADGWFKTGDVVVVTEEGYLKVVDRLKDMIIVSGFNVYPTELEDVLSTHPDVLESAVIGVADDKTGEAVKAFIVRKDESLDEQAIKSWCRDNMTAYKVPKYVEFRDELPKSNVGKVLRRELRDS